MSRFASVLRLAVAMMPLLSAVACHDSNGPFATVSLNNNADNLIFIGQSYERTVTDSLRYMWQTTGTVAEVNRGIVQTDGSTLTGNVTAGTATIVIRDGAGTQVYSGNLGNRTDDTTNTGVTGNWTVDLKMTQLKGDVVLQLRKLR